jgi:hypothetical protein
MSKLAFRKYEEALREMGLVDDQHNPTWFTDGKPDILKMLDIAGANAAKIPVEKRAAIERGLFGAQGGGGFALLADPAVREQIQALSKEMNSPEFKNRYGGFMESYNSQVTAQNARTALQDFNVTMMDIGQHVLPSANEALRNFKAILESVRNVPGSITTARLAARPSPAPLRVRPRADSLVWPAVRLALVAARRLAACWVRRPGSWKVYRARSSMRRQTRS